MTLILLSRFTTRYYVNPEHVISVEPNPTNPTRESLLHFDYPHTGVSVDGDAATVAAKLSGANRSRWHVLERLPGNVYSTMFLPDDNLPAALASLNATDDCGSTRLFTSCDSAAEAKAVIEELERPL